ncbi:ribonuclease Z [Gemmiger formicilis]|uniref:ribonuclease Z n=1 Tax=Gemmiger formicilis TaxID=745368 RepID=UPI00195C9309|nr:ribonuclease Z [Gemmiger formicilis]MBM6898348.1 ribonuclease Z [Gemmiger formicilis]
MLTVTLLGTGGTQPLPERALAALAVSVGGGTVLLDCGEGTQTALRRWGVSAYRLHTVLLTHYHGDHILGLPGLLQTLSSLGRTAPLTVVGPAGLEAVAAPMAALAGPLPFAVHWRQAGQEPFAAGPLTVTPFPLEHRVPCCGYALTLPRAGRFDPGRARAAGIPVALWSRLQAGQTVEGFTPGQVLGPPRRGLKVVYATDTRPCPAVTEAAREADLLCMDATYADDADLDKAKLYGHATCRETGALAAEAGVRRLWLTHYSAAVTDLAPGLAAAQRAYPDAVAGTDGMRLELDFDKES